jgi:ankyrin repeat protein
MEHWCDQPKRASPLGYTAMRRYDTSRGAWRDVTGTGEVARMLLAAGAPVDGEPDEQETPLITAASYGDAAVALVLIEAGADLEARAAHDSGGVPRGTALLHAAVFGMTDVVDVLVASRRSTASRRRRRPPTSAGGSRTPRRTPGCGRW